MNYIDIIFSFQNIESQPAIEESAAVSRLILSKIVKGAHIEPQSACAVSAGSVSPSDCVHLHLLISL